MPEAREAGGLPALANATEILPGLWQGDQLSGVLAAAAEFDIVVDLTAPSGARRAHHESMLYLHWPVEDGAALPDADLLDAVRDLCVSGLCAGRRVLVHCGYGRNRSGLLCALIVRSVLNCSGTEALAFVRGKRAGALQNRWFAAFLDSLP